MRAAMERAASSAASDSCWGCHVSNGPPSACRWPIGSQNCTAGPDGSAVRTVSRVISSSTSTTVSAITRFAHACPAAKARFHAASTSSSRVNTDCPSVTVPVSGVTTSGKPGVPGDRGQFLRRRGEPERHGRQTQLVAGQLAQPLAIRDESGGPRRREHLDGIALGQRRSARRETRRETRRRRSPAGARRAGRRPRPTSSHFSTRATAAPRRSKARASSRPASPAAEQQDRARAVDRCGEGSVIARPPCQTVSPAGCRRSTTASSRRARPNASRGGRSRGNARLACWCGLESQQPTWPHVRAHSQVRPGTLAEFVALLAAARCEGFAARPRRRPPPGARTSGDWRGIHVAPSRSPPHAVQNRAVPVGSRIGGFGNVGGASLLAVLVVSVLLAGIARRYDVSGPLALVVAGLLAGLIPGMHGHRTRTGPGAVRHPAAAAVVGGPGEQLRRAAQEHPPHRPAGGRACPW